MIRFGILGTARVARRLAGAVIPGATLTSVASRRRERALDFARALNIPHIHSSYASLLADPEIDAVYIPLPNHLHSLWAIRAAEAGKHVLIEKPAVLTISEARALAKAAQRNQVMIMEGFMYRFVRAHHAARDLARTGKIGRLRAVHLSWAVNRSLHGTHRKGASHGDDALHDLGVYGIDFARFITGREPVVRGAFVQRHARSERITMAHVVLTAGGVTCTVDCANDRDANYYLLSGERGSVTVRGSLSGRLLPTTLELHFIQGDERRKLRFSAENAYANEVAYFAECIRLKKQPVTGVDAIVANAKVLDRVRRRAKII